MRNSDPNWALLYKTEGDLPSEFRELRWYDCTLFNAGGRVSTWGNEQLAELPSAQAAQSEFQRLRDAAIADGFELTRSLQYDPNAFDGPGFTLEVAAAARRAFRHAQRTTNNQVNAFVLLTDSDAMTLVPFLASVDLRCAPADAHVVWNCEEWPDSDTAAYFDIAYRVILAQHRGLSSLVDHREFREQMFEGCVRALETLIGEGFFGEAAQRDELFVYFQISDSEQMDGALRRLNTDAVVARYEAWLSKCA